MPIDYSEDNPAGGKTLGENTKRCPHCNAEIPAHLRICPNCRKGVMWYDLLGSLGWTLLLFGLLAGLILFGLIVFGLMG